MELKLNSCSFVLKLRTFPTITPMYCKQRKEEHLFLVDKNIKKGYIVQERDTIININNTKYLQTFAFK